MNKFEKLDRGQMKKVLGGLVQPSDCTNDCNPQLPCADKYTCTSVKCPHDKDFYHNVCVQS